jgi:arginase family enzyme
MLLEFLNPVSEDIILWNANNSEQSLGKKLVLHTQTDFPNLETIQIAIIGAPENRGLEIETGNLDHFRKTFFAYFPGNWHLNIADLGDVKTGNEISDTYFALKTVCNELLKKKIIPIVIGGSQDLTYALYRAYDNMEQMVNLVNIDHSFDFAKENKNDAHSYLSRIIVEEPNNLHNFCNLGHQTYFTSQEEIDLIDKLYFDAVRLGEIIKNPNITEPIFRDADIVSIDLNAIQSSVSCQKNPYQPNGFDGREICTLSRYAGISDKISIFGVFNQNYSKEQSQIIAQIAWYFIEGVHYRSNEYPFEDKANYLKYNVLSNEEELVFYKSNRSERWWMEIKFNNPHNNNIKKTLLPCNLEDYNMACNGEIPEKWWKAHRKSLI